MKLLPLLFVAFCLFITLWSGVRVFSHLPPRLNISCEPCLCR